jgi:hypothetical protein
MNEPFQVLRNERFWVRYFVGFTRKSLSEETYRAGPFFMRAARSIEQVAGLAEPVLIRPKPRRPVRVPQGWMQEIEAVVDDAADDAIATQARLQWVNAGPP